MKNIVIRTAVLNCLLYYLLFPLHAEAFSHEFVAAIIWSSFHTAHGLDGSQNDSWPLRVSNNRSQQWNPETGWNAAYKVLQAAEARSKHLFCDRESITNCTVIHEHVGDYVLMLQDRKIAVLVAGSREEVVQECNSCKADISLFEFEWKGDQWVLAKSDIAIFQWGRGGIVDSSRFKVAALGPNGYGVFLTFGENRNLLSVVATVGQEWKEVLRIRISDGLTWKAAIRTDHKSKSRFDLLVSAEGKYQGIPLDTVTRYVFDGSRYRTAKEPDYLAYDLDEDFAIPPKRMTH